MIRSLESITSTLYLQRFYISIYLLCSCSGSKLYRYTTLRTLLKIFFFFFNNKLTKNSFFNFSKKLNSFFCIYYRAYISINNKCLGRNTPTHNHYVFFVRVRRWQAFFYRTLHFFMDPRPMLRTT